MNLDLRAKSTKAERLSYILVKLRQMEENGLSQDDMSELTGLSKQKLYLLRRNAGLTKSRKGNG